LAINVSEDLEKLKAANAALSLTGEQGYSHDKLNELSEAVDIIKKPN
jgi:hypothetical protein